MCLISKSPLEIGREDEPGHPNLWPSETFAVTAASADANGSASTDSKLFEPTQFKEVMTSLFDQCKELHKSMMRAVALGLGLKEEWFDKYTDVGDNTLRLLHYPAVKSKVFQRHDGQLQPRAGEHSDYGRSIPSACADLVFSGSTFRGAPMRRRCQLARRLHHAAFPRLAVWTGSPLTARDVLCPPRPSLAQSSSTPVIY